MRIIGLVKNIEVDGYERLLTIQATDKVFWCSYLQLDEYLEPGQPSRYVGANTSVDLRATLTLVEDFRLTEENNTKGLVQDIQGSPHAIVVGLITETMASDVYVLSIDESNKIKVQFEVDVELNLGDCIRVEGELTLEGDLN